MVQKIRVGDKIEVEVEYKNIGSERNQFFMEIYMRHISSGTRYYSKPKRDWTSANKVDSMEFEIKPTTAWKKGQYTLSADIYKTVVNGKLQNQLDHMSESYVADLV